MTESTQLQTNENNNTAGGKMEQPISPSPSEQQYALKWNDYQASILTSFRHLRDEEDFVDVTLACDERSFTAHKVVLSACSPYFKKLLKANPCEHPIVILRDVRSEDVDHLLRFMYNGEINIGQEQLSDFLKTAQLLQVRGLTDIAGPPSNRTSSNQPTGSLNSTLSIPQSKELKVSPTSASLGWDLNDDHRRSNHLTPPPQKRIKSADLYRAQHGLSPERISDGDGVLLHHSRDRERDRSRSIDSRSDRDRSMELRDSLLGQALEGGPTLVVPQKHADLVSLQAQSIGEDSNSSEASDRGGDHGDTMDGMNGSLDQRSASFPNFLGLQGLPGLLPGPSGVHGDNFVSRRSLEMRVRATDPRPCPKCGKIYRSAHTLRTHLEDKHTVCPGYRCVLCGTVAKSRNSLHSHMSRQHRGISTKDLPVLPMPSAFDPELASRLLAKAGVKISPAELRARASPTSGTRRNELRLDMNRDDDTYDEHDLDDPEDLTMAGNNNSGSGLYHDRLLGDKDHKDVPTSQSALIESYLQMLAESPFGITQENALVAMQAAKMAHLNAIGHNLDKMPSSLLPSNFDLGNGKNMQSNDFQRLQSSGSVTIEPAKVSSRDNSGRNEPMDYDKESPNNSYDSRNDRESERESSDRHRNQDHNRGDGHTSEDVNGSDAEGVSTA